VDLKVVLALLGGNIVLFLYSYSLTGFLISMVLIVLGFHAVKKTSFHSWEYGTVKLWYPICLLISLGVPMVMRGKFEEILNVLLNNRFMLSRKYLNVQNITLLGVEVGKISTTKQAIDNSFVHGLLSYGIILFLILSILYILMVFDFVNKKKNIELMVFVVCLMGGLTEPYLFNTSFKNITFVFLGYYLYTAKMLEKIPMLDGKWNLLKDKEYHLNFKLYDKGKAYFIRGQKAVSGKVIVITGILGAAVSVIYLQNYTFRDRILEVNSNGILVLECIRIFVTVTLMVMFVLQILYRGILLRNKED